MLAKSGNSYELAWLGNLSYENVVANAHTGDRTVVAAMDDGQNGTSAVAIDADPSAS